MLTEKVTICPRYDRGYSKLDLLVFPRVRKSFLGLGIQISGGENTLEFSRLGVTVREDTYPGLSV